MHFHFLVTLIVDKQKKKELLREPSKFERNLEAFKMSNRKSFFFFITDDIKLNFSF